ncbi:MAG: hypothetical protein M3N42_06505 [Cyanobacteriota bacterium]|nr:hypothetical protein [Cyanobacteriota bacterium]
MALLGGRVSNSIYLRSLPEKCTFTVTKLESTINKEWHTTLGTPHNLPYVVTLGSEGHRLIASSTIEPQERSGHGSPPSTAVHFTISCTIENKPVEKHGTIMFSTTEWGWARPDDSILTFGFEGEGVKPLTQKIPMLDSPHSYYLGFAIQDNKIFMAAGIEEDFWSDFAHMLVNGVMVAHTKAIEYVVTLLL